ncbi:MAG: MurR/RpiR family transcriptional regulator [Gammaproteobacteria bacterium]|nr:MurR/RpiR family transcriptional regulator [Gammaproteobacteria bacterium]
MPHSQSIQDCIYNHYDSLSGQLQRVAKFVLEHPDEVATRSLRHLASTSNLSPSAFSRLARAIGFGSYEDLRELCRGDIKKRKISFADKAKTLQNPDQGTFITRQAAASIENIDKLLNSVDIIQLESIAEKLASARKVFLVGAKSSMGFVNYLAYMGNMAFPNWRILSEGVNPAGNDLSDANRRDMLLVITKYPYTCSSIETTKFAYSKKVGIVAITDDADSPVIPFANETIMVSAESPQFFSSHVATLVLIESLMGMTVARGGSAASDRIAAVEQTNHDLNCYWSN